MEKLKMGKDLIIETIVFESDGRVSDRWKVMKNDYAYCVRTIAKKHGIEMIVIDKKNKKREEDLDWAI